MKAEEPASRQDRLAQIDAAVWVWSEENQCADLLVDGPNGKVRMTLEERPWYCDRGHFLLRADGLIGLDHADMFPRYFFSLERADEHARNFLRWRLWQVRQNYKSLERWVFEKQN